MSIEVVRLALVILLAPAFSAQGGSGDLDARLRASAAAAQSLQGPLDGAWILRDGAGRPLYLFQIVDSVGGGGRLEAAWQDPLRPPSVRAARLVFDAWRVGARLSLSFAPLADGSTTVVILQHDHGAWRGRMIENGVDRAVTLVPAPAAEPSPPRRR